VIACSGQPLGSKLPRPNSKKVAIGAAAVATAITLADPARAGRKPEQDGNSKKQRGFRSEESVPEEVLDRLDRERDAGSPCIEDETTAQGRRTNETRRGQDVELAGELDILATTELSPLKKCKKKKRTPPRRASDAGGIEAE